MDARISDVIVTIDDPWKDDLAGAVAMLTQCGLNVMNADDDNSVVEGTINVENLAALEKLECVEYVRVVFTYIADYPVDDPRDTSRA
jgi:hypothetical protein